MTSTHKTEAKASKVEARESVEVDRGVLLSWSTIAAAVALVFQLLLPCIA